MKTIIIKLTGIACVLLLLSSSILFAQALQSPTIPLITANTCGPRTLTRGVPPSGHTWYWQGTNANGTSTLNSNTTFEVTTSGIYYIRARSTSGVWSVATGIKVDIDPVDIESSFHDKPLIQATNSIRLTNGFHVQTGGTLSVKINITEECNNTLNWSEQILYGPQGEIISQSKAYVDALGHPLQTQWKDFQSNTVWATQPLYGRNLEAVGQTLPAPIQEHDFIFKKNFVTNTNNTIYTANDFDLSPTQNNVAGELNNPKPVGTMPGTLGWYYSSNNNLEGMTPVTSYPYSRTYVPDDPNPTTTKSSSPGNVFRMGAGREASSERQLIANNDLEHYFKLRKHFVKSPLPYTVELSGITNPGGQSMYFVVNQNASAVSIGSEVLVTCQQNTGTPGVWPINNTRSVTPGKSYTYAVLAKKTSAYSGVANLYVSGTNGDIVWQGPPIPSDREDWTSVSFTVPAGVTWVKLGVLWSSPVSGDNVVIAAVSLKEEIPLGANVGYKYIVTGPDYNSVDPNRLQSVSFVANDGKELATAELTANGLENWAYNFHNDAGQVVATVAPNGVNTANTNYPSFTTSYQYDHLGRTIETTSVDEGTARYVYSLDGKLRFSENQEQRNANPKRFSYTNYDYLGRLIESGEYTAHASGVVPMSQPTPEGTTSPCCPPSGDLIYNFHPHTVSPIATSVLSIVDNVGFTGVSAKIDNTRCSDYTFIEYDVAGSGYTSDANHPYQRNLQHQLSKTENVHSSTWYSYDEFGRVEWTKQNIVGLGTKTIDYTYDYFGNVTEVAFQKAQFDAYYHHYTYDLNQRLTHVHTSADGITKKLQATYTYYLHGPLKRMVLANNLQGIDYVYNIDGSLKSINHADPAKDPGNDGNDAFGMTLQYYDNDYQGANYSTGNQTLAAFANQYGGAIKGISWHSPVDNDQKRTYGFTYDKRYQLQNATFGNMTGSAGAYGFSAAANEAHREGVPAYDKNGNIQSLIRKGSTGNSLANYNYVYEANTNKLDKVNHNGSLMADYTYNSIGQMTQQVEGSSTFKLLYNASGLVKEVRNSNNQLLLQYAYDDRGNLVKKITYNPYNGAFDRAAYYVSDITGNVLAWFPYSTSNTPPSTPSERYVYGLGRIGLYKTYNNTWFYELNDHLGNVRAVIGQPETITVTATMETANAGTEQNQFFRYNNVRIVNAAIFDHTNQGVTQNAIRLSGSANEKRGLVRSFSVSPGDVVKLEVHAKYVDNNRANVSSALNSLVNSIAMGNAAPGTVIDGGAYAANSTTALPYAGLLTTSSATGPKAYLNYLVFDRNFVFNASKSGFVPVTEAAKESGTDIPHERLFAQLNITEPGYVYAYLSNDATTPIEVYFDDFTVTHEQSPIVVGADYYPYGLVMDGREIDDEPYRHGYQGQYSEKDETTGYNEFQLRFYDAKIARWLSADPYGQYYSPYLAMGNMPNIGTDPDGGFCTTCFQQLSQLFNDPVFTAMLSGDIILNNLTFIDNLSNSSSILSKVGSLQAIVPSFGRSAAFATGAVNALTSNITLGLNPLVDPSTQNHSYDYAKGQETGHTISAAWGIAESAIGLLATGAGVGLTITGGGAVAGVPLMSLGVGLSLHGGAVTARSWDNMNKVHNLKMDGNSSANEKDLTAQEIISKSRKGSIMSEFPEELLDKTLGEIEKLAKQGGPLGRKAKTASKLLKNGRFKK